MMRCASSPPTSTPSNGSAGWCAAIGAGSNVTPEPSPLDVQTGRQHALFSHAHRAPLTAGREVVYPPYLT
jgi:hypothetical protein